MIDWPKFLTSDYQNNDPCYRQNVGLAHMVVGLVLWLAFTPRVGQGNAILCTYGTMAAKEVLFDLRGHRQAGSGVRWRLVADSVTDVLFVLSGAVIIHFAVQQNLTAALGLSLGMIAASFTYHWGRK